MAKLKVYKDDELKNLRSAEFHAIPGDTAFVVFGYGSQRTAYKLSEFIAAILGGKKDKKEEKVVGVKAPAAKKDKKNK